MDFVGKATPLDQQDIEAEAKKLGIEVATIWAVTDVESNGSGFLKDKRPKILFEAKWFGTLTRGRYHGTHPNISSPYWNRALYGAAGAHQYDRLEEAIDLDRTAGLESCSWGRFQIMGSNHGVCGYTNVEVFVEAMMDDEANHLAAFGQFCVKNNLIRDLQTHDWNHFTLKYNGPGNVPDYSAKLASAYSRYAAIYPPGPADPNAPKGTIKIGSYGPSVMQLQENLQQLGYTDVTPDGDFGPKTRAAVIDFQKKNGLVPDGVVGPATWAAIRKALPTPPATP